MSRAENIKPTVRRQLSGYVNTVLPISTVILTHLLAVDPAGLARCSRVVYSLARELVHHAMASVRTSVSLPKGNYKFLEQIVADEKVFVAWIVHDAVGQYLVSQWLLLAQHSSEPR